MRSDAELRIFVSYRRDDTDDMATLIAGELAEAFPHGEIFIDKVMGFGRYETKIEQFIASCDAFLVLIGHGWINAIDGGGNRRLDDPNDVHRSEIRAAIERDTPIIPLMIEGAPVPQPEELPDELRPLCKNNATKIYEKPVRFAAGMLKVSREIEKLWDEKLKGDGDPPPTTASPGPPALSDLRGPDSPQEPTPLPGDFVFAMDAPAVGVDGSFDTAAVLDGGTGSTSGHNAEAHKEPDEPEHAGNRGGNSVWYRWTAPERGAVTFDTFGSDFDTLLAVYRGSRLGGLERVASNDDAEGGRQSRVRFPVAEGEEYRIAVDGYSGATGSIVLNWAVLSAPANDNFDEPEQLTGESGTTGGDTSGATKEPGEPDHAGSSGGSSIWYRWTAPMEGSATVDTFGSSFDTVLAVYQGERLADLRTIASNDDTNGPQSRVWFVASEGEEYRIAVDGYGREAGSVVLNWSIVQTMPLGEIVDATGLVHRERGTSVVVPFTVQQAGEVEAIVREVGETALFYVELPAFTGFGKRTLYQQMLAVSFRADYVKAVALSVADGKFALSAEVPVATLDPPACEGIIRGLVELSDAADQSQLIGEAWDQRLAACHRAQDRHLSVDTEGARREVGAQLARAGVESGLGAYGLHLGGELRTVSVHATSRVVSLMITLQGIKPGKNRAQLAGLLALNREVDVAKVGLNSSGDVVLLYEVPRVLPDLLDHARPQLDQLCRDVIGLVR